MQLIFVTQNSDKPEDARKLLPEFEIQNVDLELSEIQSLDPREIIAFKLREAYSKLGQACFVIDASLFLDCLNGFPGSFVKWYFEKTAGAEKTCRIANLFQEYGCKWMMALEYYDGQTEYFFEESLFGTVPFEPRGNEGYQWDNIFIPEGDSRTFAEMNFAEKQSVAPTAKIYSKFKDFLFTI